MEENHITVSKTARFYTQGELNEKTKQVWIVLHGFRQNAKGFLESFQPLFSDSVFFIAPEGLNRFYLNGHNGDVGASWMTKEDRQSEIDDYIRYLNRLYEHLRLDAFSVKINALGFSQGSSTLTRWVDSTPHRIDNTIVYAGDIAPELLPLKENSGLKRTSNIFICGNRDHYFPADVVLKMKEAYKELNLTHIDFDGGHEIKTNVLASLMAM